MKWLAREGSLVTALAAVILVVEPSWLGPIGRIWLVAVALLASGAIVARAFGQIPPDPAPSGKAAIGQFSEIRQMRDIEQANDFLLAVNYQLYPFLLGALGEIAAQRLLAHHHVDLQREPERARQLLGEEGWGVIAHATSAEGELPWKAISLAQLAAATDALEKV
jgi:hypothetical protein